MVAIAIKQRLAEQLVNRDPAKAVEVLRDLQTDAADALDNLRDLARGIYPPLLADQGLAVALNAQAKRSPLPVTIEANALSRYPQQIEAAVYFCCLEALQNVAKYANASHVTLRLTERTGHLEFEVQDDGRGFDPSTTAYGTGLQGMADRLSALGGAIEVRSAPAEGTTLTGRLPIPQEAGARAG